MFVCYSAFSVVLLCTYLIVILCYIFYWNRLNHWDLPSPLSLSTKVAVLVPARNEADKITNCLEAVLAQDYPKQFLAIYVIDDHSTDETADIVAKIAAEHEHVHLICLSDGKEGKKAALAAGIQTTQQQLIVTTDGDCIMEKHWLAYIVSYYEKYKPKFIAAPVLFYEEKNALEYFQSLDFMGMMAVSAAGIEGEFMGLCNGANLAYERSAFEAVNGFEGIDHLPSGDDMLLLQKIQAKFPKEIAYLKNRHASTFTHAKSTLAEFMSQRLRWASKSSAYKGWQVWFMMGIVWVLSMNLVFDLIVGCWTPFFLFWFAIKFATKAMADFFLLTMMAFFFKRHDLMKYFPISTVLHWLYIVLVGTLGIFKRRIKWKGRSFSN